MQKYLNALPHLRRRSIYLPIVFSVLLPGNLAAAQEIGLGTEPVIEADMIIYNPAYFARYAANTAAEMVQQIPGFALENESSARGFGQGSSNLLINGRRPTSKNSSAQTQLERIPASAVVRIEILKNGSPELAGQSGLIANVVMSTSSNLAGTAELGAAAIKHGFADAKARLSLIWGRGDWGFNAGAARTVGGWRGEGSENLYDPDWVATEIRDEWAEEKRLGHEITLGANWTGLDGRALNLNFKGERIQYNYEQFTNRYAPSTNALSGTGLGFINNINDELEYGYEASGDYSVPAFGGMIKLVGLRRQEDSQFTFSSTDRAADNSFDLFKGTRNPVETESLLRGLYTRNINQNSILELAVEGALNKLDQNSTFTEDTGAGFSNIDVSGSNRAVKEKRGEVSATFSHKAGSHWLLQGSIAGEYSAISVEGAPEASRHFFRSKGFASMQYSFNERSRMWLRLDRSVGQLDLYNFVSAVNIFEETETSGNIEILPDQSWDVELSGEYRFGDSNVAKISLTYTSIEDLQATVPLSGGGEGPGNLENNAEKLVAEASMTIATDNWGLKGGKFDIIANVSDISLIDPVTGETHGLERSDFWLYQINFHQDVPNTDWAWGGYIRHWHRRGAMRVNQRFLESTRPWLEFFIEHKNFLGMTARLDIAHLPAKFARRSERTFYAPDRNGQITGFEVSDRSFNQSLRFNLTRNF